MYIWILIVFLLGTSIGSFLNVVVFRTREKKSVAKGRSKCQTCEIPIKAYDLIPIVSFFVLKGRCRNCKNVISWQYPLVELATGLLFVLVFLRYAFGFSLPDSMTADNMLAFMIRDFIFISFLVILFVYDLKHMLILDRFTVPAMIVALLLNLWLGVPPWSLLIGALAIAGFFAIQVVVSKGTWVGGGDVRLGAVIGFMLGLEEGLAVLFLAYLIGAIIGILLLAVKKAGMRTKIPLGAFLSLSTLIVLFAGNAIIDWYLGFFII